MGLGSASQLGCDLDLVGLVGRRVLLDFGRVGGFVTWVGLVQGSRVWEYGLFVRFM